MKFLDNSKVKLYWEKIKKSSRGLDIIPFHVFERVWTSSGSEIIALENGIFRLSNIVPCHKAELHGYVFSHRGFREIEKFKAMLQTICEKYSLHRVECIVPKTNKGLQRLLEMVQFKNEGIRENGVFVNGLCVDGIGYVYIR